LPGETPAYPTFGYAKGRAAIFDLDRPGAPLPKGWSSDVAAWGENPTAEAITERIERNPGPLKGAPKPAE
jgi:hypothetical protein